MKINKQSKTYKSILDIACILVIFGIGQLVGGIVGALLGGLVSKMTGGSSYAWMTALALCFASLVTIGLMIAVRYKLTSTKWLEKPHFIAEINPGRLRWRLAPVMLIATFAGAVSTGCLGQALGVEDTLEDTMQGLANNPVGVITIVLIGPLSEEIIFRHGMLGGMLRRGVNPWIAILVSSLLFGIIHWNPIQILFASALGVMLGILYTKSQSIIPSLLYHIINNGFAVAVMLITGKEQDPTADIFETPPVLYSAAVVAAAICIPLFIYYWRKPTLNNN
ncbi:MAG: CPBP family intramembrane metalloprotease [Bacteroidaceae bacterium]|nr:CPBP family intramembrane metalloprotease [Bacteroidaceae bacterium]